MTRISCLSASALIRVAPQALGHRRDAVGLIDRKRDVSEYDGSLPSSVMSVPCSVVMTCGTCCPPAVVDARICLREIRGGGVRDRVMRVDDVERELARQLHDLVRERQQVLRLAKQRVGRRVRRGGTRGPPRSRQAGTAARC